MGTTVTSGGVGVAVLGVMTLAYVRPTRTLVHELLDGTGTPDVTLRPFGSRKGDLVFLCADEVAATALESLHTSSPATLSLASTDRPHLDGLRYVVAEGDISVELDIRTRRRWTVTVPYREVGS